MSERPTCLDQMLDAWNERDSSKVRDHLEAALAPDVRFVDPSIDIVGLDAFEANVHHVHQQLPGAAYSRISDVDSHHGHHRYDWAIHSADGELVTVGFDVTVVNDDDRIQTVMGFFGPLQPH